MSRTQLRYLDGSKVKVEALPNSPMLRITVEDEFTILSGTVRRVFPLSRPDRHFSFQDAAGKEMGVLNRLDELDPESRRIAEEHLDRRYFTPRIEKIDNLKLDGGMWLFEVQTQRGPAQFYVRNWRDNSHEVRANRWHIQTVDGQRYEIPDVTKLDAKSTALMQKLF